MAHFFPEWWLTVFRTHGSSEGGIFSQNKNKGEACSLAYAKATGIPYFATDEKDLQPIIDKRLNTGTDDITCLRIIDIIQMARKGEIDIKRKICKVLWVIAGKDKDLFNKKAWPKDLND